MGSERILNYRDLDAWNVAMALCVLVYEVVGLLPRSEKHELSSRCDERQCQSPRTLRSCCICSHR
jgi:hypothetical protein